MSQLVDRGLLRVSTNRGLERHAEPRVHPVRHVGRWVAMIVVAVLVAMLAHSLVADGNYQWGVVGHYFTTGVILSGLRLTIELTFISMGIGIALGTVLAVMRMSSNPVISGASLRLHLVLPRHATARANHFLVQPRVLVSTSFVGSALRTVFRAFLDEHVDHDDGCRDPCLGSQRGRIHVRNRPSGNPLGRRGTD